MRSLAGRGSSCSHRARRVTAKRWAPSSTSRVRKGKAVRPTPSSAASSRAAPATRTSSKTCSAPPTWTRRLPCRSVPTVPATKPARLATTATSGVRPPATGCAEVCSPIPNGGYERRDQVNLTSADVDLAVGVGPEDDTPDDPTDDVYDTGTRCCCGRSTSTTWATSPTGWSTRTAPLRCARRRGLSRHVLQRPQPPWLHPR